MEDRWIQTKNLYTLLGLEPFFLLTALILLAWTFYKIFLTNVSEERHQSLRRRFRSLLKSFLALTLLFTFSLILRSEPMQDGSMGRLAPYVAVLTFSIGGIVFIQVSRLIILQYLFLGSIRAGVPILIVNIFSLLMSLLLGLWGASQIFNIQVGPLLATSAAFSIVLGLAIQDTLGNLFAGIAMQIDHVFEIGDWVEISVGPQKIVGQVKEITWRATTLIGWSDEVILVPNRVVAGSSISNYQNGEVPLVRNQVFRLPFDVDAKEIKETLLNSIHKITDIRKFPEPSCFVSEVSDSWMSFKLVYYINSFGSQYIVADRVLSECLSGLHAKGHKVASNKLQILREPEIQI